MANHTPGPWIWDKHWLNAQAAKSGTILWYTTDDDGVHCSEADVHLIAAAPEMLEALEAIVKAPYGVALGDLERARAAIAKAKGQEVGRG